jgi:hypothetical protein
VSVGMMLIAFFIITLFARLYVRVGILHIAFTCQRSHITGRTVLL